MRRPYILRAADNQRVILAFSPVNSTVLCAALRQTIDCGLAGLGIAGDLAFAPY
jgi:hypothetical protein